MMDLMIVLIKMGIFHTLCLLHTLKKHSENRRTIKKTLTLFILREMGDLLQELTVKKQQ